MAILKIPVPLGDVAKQQSGRVCCVQDFRRLTVYELGANSIGTEDDSSC